MIPIPILVQPLNLSFGFRHIPQTFSFWRVSNPRRSTVLAGGFFECKFLPRNVSFGAFGDASTDRTT